MYQEVEGFLYRPALPVGGGFVPAKSVNEGGFWGLVGLLLHYPIAVGKFFCGPLLAASSQTAPGRTRQGLVLPAVPNRSCATNRSFNESGFCWSHSRAPLGKPCSVDLLQADLPQLALYVKT